MVKDTMLNAISCDWNVIQQFCQRHASMYALAYIPNGNDWSFNSISHTDACNCYQLVYHWFIYWLTASPLSWGFLFFLVWYATNTQQVEMIKIFCSLIEAKRCIYASLNLAKLCSQGSSKQQVSVGSDNGLALNRQQAIIWPDDGLVD